MFLIDELSRRQIANCKVATCTSVKRDLDNTNYKLITCMPFAIPDRTLISKKEAENGLQSRSSCNIRLKVKTLILFISCHPTILV